MKKWKKVTLGFLLTSLIVVLSVIIYFIFTFVHKEKLVEINLPKNDYKIEIYYIDTGALGPSVIQIRKVYNIFDSEIVRNIEGPKTIESLRFLHSAIEIVDGFGDTVMVKY